MLINLTEQKGSIAMKKTLSLLLVLALLMSLFTGQAFGDG